MARPPYGPRITDPEAILFRRVGEGHVQAGRVSSQAFVASGKERDMGRISLADGRTQTVEAAFRFFAQERVSKGKPPAGIVVLRVRHFDFPKDREILSLPVYEDPLTLARDGLDNPTHCAADIASLSQKDVRSRFPHHLHGKVHDDADPTAYYWDPEGAAPSARLVADHEG